MRRCRTVQITCSTAARVKERTRHAAAVVLVALVGLVLVIGLVDAATGRTTLSRRSRVEQGLSDPVEVEDVVVAIVCQPSSQNQGGSFVTVGSEADPRPLLGSQATQFLFHRR